MSPPVRIAVDAMGGDAAPGVNIRGSLQALETDPDLSLVLVGPRETVLAELTKHNAVESDRLRIVHSDEVISMDDHAVTSARKKRESSIHVGMRLVKDKAADAFLSAGNSGAVMAVALLELGRLPGVERPAIVVRLPTAEGSVTLLDVGANVDCRPSQLLQFAQMGDVYARVIDGVAHPRVALLSNGSEAHKGNELTRAAHELLAKSSNLNYLGYVEGFDLFRGVADVVVCDGFVGNVVLKAAEGLADTSFRWFRQQVRRDIFGLVGVFFLKRVLRKFRRKFDYQPYGSALLLGIDALVLISHGSSTQTAIANGILTAKKGVEEGFLRKIGAVMTGGQAK
jgi:glycerol-3-phosphate acyltransferase PlsX